jgi:hypothetical protein
MLLSFHSLEEQVVIVISRFGSVVEVKAVLIDRFVAQIRIQALGEWLLLRSLDVLLPNLCQTNNRAKHGSFLLL